MKVRFRIIGSLALMIFVVTCILALFMVLTSSGMQRRGVAMHNAVTSNLEENVRQELLDLAATISNYVLALEGEIDRNMLNAAYVLYEVDRILDGRVTLAELERLKVETGMSDLYLGDMNGVFTLSTEPEAAGISLFDIWDGYRMLVTGESKYLPSDLKLKFETGEIFKFTAIPRANRRGVLESAMNADAIERHLQYYITTNKGIKSMNLFDFTLLTLTSNHMAGETPVYTKGKFVPETTAEIAGLFKDSSKMQISMYQRDATIYYPVMDGNRVRYVLFIDLDTTGFFALTKLVDAPLEALVEQSNFLSILSQAAVFVVLLFFTVFISILVIRALKPLGFFNSMLASFSEGNFALTVPNDFISRKDEMGEISHSSKNALEKMKHLIATIRDQSLSLQSIGGDLANQMTQTSRAINGITSNINNMKDQTIRQASVVTETGKNVEQIMETVNQLHDQIAIQSENITQSSRVIKEMIEKIQIVGDTLNRNNENVATLAKSSEVGRKDLQKVSEDIKEIARESVGILEINAVMENIASQTNLLSMNAAIEAAHAGESGKGFAVVAGEIRKLAETSSQQSKTTAEKLKKIKSSIDGITRSMEVVFENFESIEREVHTVSGQEESIRSIMQAQEHDSRDVLHAITLLNSISEKIRQESEEMSGKSIEVIRETTEMESSAREISNGMNDMAKGTEEINKAVLEVHEITEKNENSINTLTAEITKFKVE